MPSHPTLFDDDPSGTSTPAEGPPRGPQPDGDRGPNYLLRRAIVVGAAVVAVAGGAVVVSRFISSSGGDDSSGAASTEWNRVVTVDARTGRVLLFDDAGEQTARVDPELTSPQASAVVGPTAVVAAPSGVAVVDLANETSEPIDMAASTIVSPTGTTRTLIAPADSGDRGVLVHGPTGDVIDTAEFAPVAGARYEFATARADPSGRHVLVTDTGNFQSVLFSFDRDEPSYFPGLALAVSDDLVVTTQNVGNAATVTVFDHDGEERPAGRTASVRAALISGEAIHLVTVDGDIMSMTAGSDGVATRDELDVGTVLIGTVLPTGDRLVVTGVGGTAIVDDTGDVVVTVADHVPALDQGALRGSTCIDLTGSQEPGELVIVDARDGSTTDGLAVTADVVSRSADGCTLGVVHSAGYDVVDAAGDIVPVDDDTLVALSPDGTRTVVERGARLLLTAPGDDTVEPVDLGGRGRTVWFTDL